MFPEYDSVSFCNFLALQIQHPRSQLNRFDLVITPRHDFYPLTPQAQEQVPRFLHRWITPREPPDRHVVWIVNLYYHYLRTCRNSSFWLNF